MIPFSSTPSTYSSSIAWPLGENDSVSSRWRSTSAGSSIMNNPRCPPESAGFSTAGSGIDPAAARTSESRVKTACRGCGTPPASRRARISVLSVIARATSAPMLGRPERVRDLGRRQDGAIARDGEHSVDPELAHRRNNGVDVGEVDVDAHVRDCEADGVGITVRRDHAMNRAPAHTGSQATARRLPRGREVSPRSVRTLLLLTRSDGCRSGAFQGAVCFAR